MERLQDEVTEIALSRRAVEALELHLQLSLPAFSSESATFAFVAARHPGSGEGARTSPGGGSSSIRKSASQRSPGVLFPSSHGSLGSTTRRRNPCCGRAEDTEAGA